MCCVSIILRHESLVCSAKYTQRNANLDQTSFHLFILTLPNPVSRSVLRRQCKGRSCRWPLEEKYPLNRPVQSLGPLGFPVAQSFCKVFCAVNGSITQTAFRTYLVLLSCAADRCPASRATASAGPRRQKRQKRRSAQTHSPSDSLYTSQTCYR